ncbi:hypothetical protein OAK45_04185 [Verrucomicrobia bacterium]|nr:hypothetical protein [Verrucomicrobiota bacterium]
MKRIFITLTAFAVTASAQVRLQIMQTENSISSTQTNIKMDQILQMGGQEIITRNSQTFTTEHATAKDRAPDGTLDANATIKKWVSEWIFPGVITMKFDSAAPVTNLKSRVTIDDKPIELKQLQPIIDLLYVIKAHPVKYVYYKSGAIKEVKLPSLYYQEVSPKTKEPVKHEWPEACIKKKDTTAGTIKARKKQLKDALFSLNQLGLKNTKELNLEDALTRLDRLCIKIKQEFNPEETANVHKQQHSRIPNKAISKGDTWVRNETMKLDGNQVMNFQIKYKYEGTITKTKNTPELHRITGQVTDVAYEAKVKDTAPLKVKNSQLKVAKTKIELLFDNKRGKFVQSNSLIQIIGYMTFEANGQELPGDLYLSIERNTSQLPNKK